MGLSDASESPICWEPAWSIWVSMAPGWTELALMPSRAYCIAVHLASRWTAALEALYAADHACPTSPAPDDMLMIDPPPARLMWGITSLVPRNVPLPFTAITWSQSSTVVSSTLA